MAARLRVPVVPVRLSGLYEIYSVRDTWPRRGAVRVAVGAPMFFDTAASYGEIARRLRETIAALPGADA
jgi:1-acyl-sn-glycerol-3-phosphate acyltransferase